MAGTTHKNITLSHGSGGVLTHRLIRDIFLKTFNNRILRRLEDAAAIGRLAFTTDAYVVKPLFFPGGDIGRLAVCGTVNDLAMKGAVPKYLSITFIIEEGFPVDELKIVSRSAQQAAAQARVRIVAGDTKVVEKGAADRLFITTAGIGIIPRGARVSLARVRPDDVIIINGTIGDHGIAVLNKRLDLGLTMKLASDCAPLGNLVKAMLSTGTDRRAVHMMRDPTRGGVATTLNEIADRTGLGIIIAEEALPIRPAVHGACELLGLDPLYVANEGKVIAIVARKAAGRILRTMRRHRLGRGSAVIGEVVRKPRGVFLKTGIGGLRPLLMLETEMLPRIC